MVLLTIRKKLQIAPVMLVWRLMMVFMLFSVQRLLFYLINIHYFPQIPVGHLWELMISGLKYDLSAVLCINSLYIILMLVPIRLKYNELYKKFARTLFMASNSLALVVNFVDVVYFRYILRRTDFSIFSEFRNDTQLWKVALVGMAQYWYLLALFIGMILFLRLVYSDHKKSGFIRSHALFYVLSTLIIVLFSGISVVAVEGGFLGKIEPVMYRSEDGKAQKPIESAIVMNTPFSIIQTIHPQKVEELNFYNEDEVERIYTPIHQGSATADFKPMNVVILILESFTREVVGSLNTELEGGHYKGYTPFLDSLIRHSYTWKYSFANGIKSIDAIPSVIAGVPSLNQSFVVSPYSRNGLEGLAASLKKKGYDAAFFHGGLNGTLGFNTITDKLAIKKYYGQNEYGRKEDSDGYWGIPDELFLNYCASNFGKLKEPFFASVFTLSSHHPYILPGKYENSFKGGPVPLYKCIEYSDYSLKQFFKVASAEPWFKNTLFVLTADHSLPSGDHKEYITPSGLFSIPIIFYLPDSKLVGLDSGLMQQIDIYPTVLGYLNYDEPYFAFGSDRFSKDIDPFVVNYVNGYYQFMEGDFLLQSDGKSLLTAYRFKEDTQYRHNLADRPDSAMNRHFQRFKAFLQQYNNRMLENRLTIR